MDHRLLVLGPTRVQGWVDAMDDSMRKADVAECADAAAVRRRRHADHRVIS